MVHRQAVIRGVTQEKLWKSAVCEVEAAGSKESNPGSRREVARRRGRCESTGDREIDLRCAAPECFNRIIETGVLHSQWG
jgi:hypothetical protein